MLSEMQDRGADSAGAAIYGHPDWSPPGHGCVSLLNVDAESDVIGAELAQRLGVAVNVNHVDDILLLSAPLNATELLDAAWTALPDALVAGFGKDLAVLKGVGTPRELAHRWGLQNARGWQGVGHTRM